MWRLPKINDLQFHEYRCTCLCVGRYLILALHLLAQFAMSLFSSWRVVYYLLKSFRFVITIYLFLGLCDFCHFLSFLVTWFCSCCFFFLLVLKLLLPLLCWSFCSQHQVGLPCPFFFSSVFSTYPSVLWYPCFGTCVFLVHWIHH